MVFRDGVGDGQLDFTREYEIAQILSGIKYFNVAPKFTFCVVQKRIHTKIFLKVSLVNVG